MHTETTHPVVIYCPWTQTEIEVGHSRTKASWHYAAGCPLCGERHAYEVNDPRAALEHEAATSKFRRPHQRARKNLP